MLSLKTGNRFFLVKVFKDGGIVIGCNVKCLLCANARRWSIVVARRFAFFQQSFQLSVIMSLDATITTSVKIFSRRADKRNTADVNLFDDLIFFRSIERTVSSKG